MLKVLITFIWFGALVPEEYLTPLADAGYPTEILLNPENNMTYTHDVIKTDRYKLQVLKNGGIYSDFENILNYDCLMDKLASFNGEMLSMDFKDRKLNHFIYVPASNTGLIREILQNQGRNNCVDSLGVENIECFGASMFQKYRNRITVQNLDSCIQRMEFSLAQWEAAMKMPEENKLITDKYIKKITLRNRTLALQNKIKESVKRAKQIQRNITKIQKKSYYLEKKAQPLERLQKRLANFQSRLEDYNKKIAQIQLKRSLSERLSSLSEKVLKISMKQEILSKVSQENKKQLDALAPQVEAEQFEKLSQKILSERAKRNASIGILFLSSISGVAMIAFYVYKIWSFEKDKNISKSQIDLDDSSIEPMKKAQKI